MPANTYIWILSPLLYCICAGVFFILLYMYFIYRKVLYDEIFQKIKRIYWVILLSQDFFSILFEH